jgi:hypothetical protein
MWSLTPDFFLNSYLCDILVFNLHAWCSVNFLRIFYSTKSGEILLERQKEIQWKTLNYLPSLSEFYFGKVVRIHPLQNKILLGHVFNPLFGNCPVWQVRTTSFNPG